MYPIVKFDKLPPKREMVETLEILKQLQFSVAVAVYSQVLTEHCD
mgnify:CR=1 FL=1